jgi:hypothetical protein
MGFSFRVRTDATGGVECWLDSNGRLRDAKNDFVFTEKVFNDAMDAEMFLLTADLFAQFMRAYIAAPYWREIAEKKSQSSDSPSIDVLSFYGVEATLDEWLSLNEVNVLDAELLETLPDEFHDEFCERLQFQGEYETKWQDQQRRSK